MLEVSILSLAETMYTLERITYKTLEFSKLLFLDSFSPQQRFAEENLAMQQMLNIGMIEQKHHFVKHQGVFFSSQQPNRTHGQSLDVGTFFVGRIQPGSPYLEDGPPRR